MSLFLSRHAIRFILKLFIYHKIKSNFLNRTKTVISMCQIPSALQPSTLPSPMWLPCCLRQSNLLDWKTLPLNVITTAITFPTKRNWQSKLVYVFLTGLNCEWLMRSTAGVILSQSHCDTSGAKSLTLCLLVWTENNKTWVDTVLLQGPAYVGKGLQKSYC